MHDFIHLFHEFLVHESAREDYAIAVEDYDVRDANDAVDVGGDCLRADNLRPGEVVLDDGFAGFWISANRVPSLPTTILAFSDVALAVCSSLWHGISPFRNEQYRNQGNKATEKPNCYQKVIICTSEPRRLIFDYCGAISALPEAFFFGYSGAIFERLKVSFHRLR